MKDYCHYSLLQHNTFGMEARCSRFLQYESVEEACQVAAILRTAGLPFVIIGAGSNLLLTRDYEGIVVRSGMKGIANDNGSVTVASGECFDDFVAWSLSHGLYGLENLSLIPGDVGASAVQNIGAYGVEVASIIHEVETIEVATGQPRVFQVQECEYGYRDSIFKNRLKGEYIVTAVVFRLSLIPKVNLDYGPLQAFKSQEGVPTAKAIRDAVIDIRRSKLPEPSVLGSAGSFFKNPVIPVEAYQEIAATYADVPHYVVDDRHIKIPAAWLIEQCGWKGKQHGEAAVYEKQPLILVNMGNATPDDIIELAALIEQSVKEKFKIQLHPEVNYI